MSSPLPKLWPRLLFPFAAGYFLSYLFRTVNAVLGPVIAESLALPDNALGLLTSTYFLAFGLAQLPLGILLDRFGPRRVEVALLLIAALGAAAFGLAESLGELAFARALIGLGVSACLMAAMKAFTLFFPADRQASMTGWIMASGGLGALAASRPLEILLGVTGWREIMFGLAIITVAVAAYIWRTAPESEEKPAGGTLAAALTSIASIYRNPYFWRFAPMGFWMTGGYMAVQGLWASRWMAEIEGLSGAAIGNRLSLLSLAMLGGFLFLGFFATRLVHLGISMTRVYGTSMLLAVLGLGLIILAPELGGGVAWALLGACFSLSNIAYTLVAQAFPPALSGRATTAFNLLVFAGAFGLQWGIGLGVDALQATGMRIGDAYRVAFTVLLVGQALSLFAFALPARTRQT